MKDDVIGRKHEKKLFERLLKSPKSELCVVFGRRRVGKTFLIRNYFQKETIFHLTGLYEGELQDQLQNFAKEINHRSNKELEIPKNWLDAFSQLESHIKSLRSKKKKVIFIDEFPWMATPKSRFLTAFENFWNHFASHRNDLVVVICGSAASYMVKKIINNKGGLHNRITQTIRLLPFNLAETKLYLEHKNINYTLYDIAQLYMSIGGIPFYLDQVQKGLSVTQNIDRMCFEKDGVLRNEFLQLYQSLFSDSERHMILIRTLAKQRKGITRKELIKKSKLPSGGDFSLKLFELIESGFVHEYQFYQNKKKETLYRLTDEYSLFYLQFIEPKKHIGKGAWQTFFNTKPYNSWSGFSFESLCLKHVEQIKRSLRIDAIHTQQDCWFNQNSQIDLLIDRADNVMNICEMKFYNAPFTIDKKTYQNIKNKTTQFRESTKTRKNLFVTMVTTFGLNENEYSRELVQNVVDLEGLFGID